MELVNWLVECSRLGQPKNCEDIKSAAWMLSEQNNDKAFGPEGPSKGWLHGFFSRHPNIVKRTSENLSTAGAAVTKENIMAWFDVIINYCQEENLMDVWDDPKRIINADESGFRLLVGGQWGYVPRGTKNVIEVSSSAKDTMSVLFTIGADGHIYCPFIIFPGERLSTKLTESIPKGVNYSKTASGWQNQKSFMESLTMLNSELIAREIQKPVILFLDNHSSHASLEVFPSFFLCILPQKANRSPLSKFL